MSPQAPSRLALHLHFSLQACEIAEYRSDLPLLSVAAAEKNPKYLRSKLTTPFYQKSVDYTCPDGLIVPLLYGLRSLLKALCAMKFRPPS
jgi:hypothetical protein